MIPVSVIVATKNEQDRIAACLAALSDFGEVIVVDSNSDDNTQNIAVACGARVENFIWDGAYPKKRQWCLDHLTLAHDWVFFVDADEVVTRECVEEITALFEGGVPPERGYFVRSDYIWKAQHLKHGLKNNKLVLFDRRCVEFPVVDDLDIPGMGEIEGHYQPVLKSDSTGDIGQIMAGMLHDMGDDDGAAWEARHQRYAQWEAGMIARDAYPHDHGLRQLLKHAFRCMPLRALVAFLHCYIFKCGFLDGALGYDFARARMRYYAMVSRALTTNKAAAR